MLKKTKDVLKRTYKYILFTIVVMAVIIAGVLFYFKLNKCKAYSCLGFPGKENWKINSIYREDQNYWNGLIDAPNYLLRLEKKGNISELDARQLTLINLMQTKGLFERARSPYPGIISDEITCGDKYKPIEKKLSSDTGIEIVYLSAVMNNQMQYGVCTQEQVKYSSFASFFYCKNTKEWFHMELIRSKDKSFLEEEFKSLIQKVNCK